MSIISSNPNALTTNRAYLLIPHNVVEGCVHVATRVLLMITDRSTRMSINIKCMHKVYVYIYAYIYIYIRDDIQ